MIGRATLAAVALLATTACGTRDLAPPTAEAQIIAPNKITDFNSLYGSNCAGCHGAAGNGGPAMALSNPIYLAVADDTTIRRVVSDGVPGTSMPAFAQDAGGMLTPAQIDAIVGGIRSRWARADALGGAVPPPYASPTPGDPKHGGDVFGVYCASCHGADGSGKWAGSIVNGSYLALVSDQGLRTTVICGRPELGVPDWRSDLPGMPMSPQDVTDVVAWLSAQRPQFPGQPYSTGLQSRGGLQ
jgi:mono/diheme cytochrome c family protein